MPWQTNKILIILVKNLYFRVSTGFKPIFVQRIFLIFVAILCNIWHSLTGKRCKKGQNHLHCTAKYFFIAIISIADSYLFLFCFFASFATTFMLFIYSSSTGERVVSWYFLYSSFALLRAFS